ncbi:MurR/RpiR family transcriptional regulator [Bacillaceae bacterium]
MEGMHSKCLSRIRALYSSLSRKEKSVADYILENAEEIVHLSITELAENADCAEATIFRLCKRLGYKGYQALKIALASEIVKPSETFDDEIQPDDDMLTLAKKVFARHIVSLNDTVMLQKEEDLQAAARAIANAKRVEFYGAGESAAIAQDAYRKFIHTGLHCTIHVDAYLQRASAALLDKECVAVAISLTEANKDFVEVLQIAKEAGATTIGITDDLKSPLTKLVDLTLFASAKGSGYPEERIPSGLSQMALLDVLYVATFLIRRERVVGQREKIGEAAGQKRYFY